MRGLAAVLVVAALGLAAGASRRAVDARERQLAEARDQAALAARESAARALRLETTRLEEQVRLLAGNEQLRLGITTNAQTVQDQIAEEGLRNLRAHPLFAVARQDAADAAHTEVLVAHGFEQLPAAELQRLAPLQQALHAADGAPASGALRLPAGAALLAAAPVTSLDQLVHGVLVIGDVLGQRSLDNLATQARASLLLSDGAHVLGTQGAGDQIALLQGAVGSEGQALRRTITDPAGELAARALPLGPQLHLWVATTIAPEAQVIARSTELTLALVWTLALGVSTLVVAIAWRRGRRKTLENKPSEQPPAPPETPLEAWAGVPAATVPAVTGPALTGPAMVLPVLLPNGQIGQVIASGTTSPFLLTTPNDPAIFGRYRLLERLGSGGMAEVWTAVVYGAEGFRRPFVVKRIRRDMMAHADLVQQFIDEANLASQLVHSNVVPVFDFGQVQGEYFLAQEYILGRDLGRLVQALAQAGKRLDPQLALYVCGETLKALDYAHTLTDKTGQPLGIVHRDISPNNILLSGRGEVKLIDFGIAKSATKVAQTELGTVKGNIRFMAPEQARGEATDGRTDLFSLGATLYYALRGEPLYTVAGQYEQLLAAARGPGEEERAKIAELPAPWNEILLHVLAANAAERFPSAQALLEHVWPIAPADGARRLSQLLQELFGEELRRQEQQFNDAAIFATPPGGSAQPEGVPDDATVQRLGPRVRQGLP